MSDFDSRPDTDDGAGALSGNNLVERSVSELSAALKRTVEDNFGQVRVRGEIGRVSRPGSGHVYLDLKDDRAVLAAVIWKGVASRFKTQPEQGLEVVVTGKLTTFAGQSKYQIIIESMEPAGAGALMALLEERKKKLTAEGLFAEERKQLLPYMPRVIGVVTSPSGAVIRDVLHRIADRFPLHVIVWPVRVQGETSAAEVVNAIRGFNALEVSGPISRPDLLIVARGGGSIEDLWGFNDEEVVRSAAQSDIPVISAVGHETDWTLIDLAADVRAPTPTGAAEMAVPVKAEIEAFTATLGARLANGLRRKLDAASSDLRAAMRGLGRPEDILSAPRQNLDNLTNRLSSSLLIAARSKRAELTGIGGRLTPDIVRRRIRAEGDRTGYAYNRLQTAFFNITERNSTRTSNAAGRLNWKRLERIVTTARNRFDQSWRLVESLSHERILERGFALVRGKEGQAITHAAGLTAGSPFSVQFQDGTVDAVAGKGSAKTGSKTKSKSSPGKVNPDQGKLF
ncbi:MAG: exodeoxyribonuclease VII large subunit [Rhizobiaceae bacterium]